MSGNIIEIVDLTKRYGSNTAVDNLNLTIQKGEIFGLLGPNGAGKSTSILMMMGLTEPDSGSVRVCGIDSTSNPIEVKRRVGYLPEDVGFYDDMTGLETLLFTARLNRIPIEEATQRAEKLLSLVGLSEAVSKKTGTYSRGMRQRLGLGDVLIKNPEVIILDEPTLGIDPTGMREFLGQIVELSRDEGITVLFSSHNLYQVQQVCDRVGLFVNGKLLAQGNIQDLSQELFSQSPFAFEVNFSGNESAEIDGMDEKKKTEWLKDTLGHIDGIIKILSQNKTFLIECSCDLGAEIARTIIESGAELNYLSKKEYGLDDIYYRYFEGGTDNE